jgi:hypothetical protein
MGLACVFVRKRRSWDPTTSRSVPGEDQNAPLRFQEPMDKTHQSVSIADENILGLLHGDGVIDMQGTMLGPFP